jgi:hypothetical protein
MDNIGEVLFTIEELKVNEDPEFILAYESSSQFNHYLLKHFFIDYDNDRYGSF